MRLSFFLVSLAALAGLCACQSSSPSLTVCENKYRDGSFEFLYDGCLWRIDRTNGPDFGFWYVKDASGKIVANIYLGSAPDVKYKNRDFAPKSIGLGTYILSEFLGEEGYEALLELPKDLYGRATYVHVFSPTLNVEDLGRVKSLVRSMRMEE